MVSLRGRLSLFRYDCVAVLLQPSCELSCFEMIVIIKDCHQSRCYRGLSAGVCLRFSKLRVTDEMVCSIRNQSYSFDQQLLQSISINPTPSIIRLVT